jgi:hypothetical protein
MPGSYIGVRAVGRQLILKWSLGNSAGLFLGGAEIGLKFPENVLNVTILFLFHE